MLASCQDDFTTSEVIIPDIPNPSVTVESSVLGKNRGFRRKSNS